jgi:AcrR family transcriptional regulator
MTSRQAEQRTKEGVAESDSGTDKSADVQRRKIANALSRCIRARGYAATSLADIATEAGMSPSLMRYYFSNKEPILEAYYRLFSDKIMADLLRLKRNSPTQWLSDYCSHSIGAGIDKASLSLLIEVFAVAMHYEPLARLKARYDGFAMQIYRDFFEWAGTVDGQDVETATQTARALELGIKLNAVFQRDFDGEKATLLFYGEMRRLANLPKRALKLR